MTGAKSRWADDGVDSEARKREKEEKKRAKAEKERLKAERKKEKQKQDAASKPSRDHEEERPIKRRRLSQDDGQAPQDETANAPEPQTDDGTPRPLLQLPRTTWSRSRHVDNFERLNHIEEGSYGWVSRARDLSTGTIVALKKLKMDNSGEGFPVTALREIQALRAARHRHIVNLIEVIVGKSKDEVYLVMDFIEHDLKTLQEGMAEPFLMSEIKTLMIQIVAGVGFLHDNWILHVSSRGSQREHS
jgi:cell division cycle 2-like protein